MKDDAINEALKSEIIENTGNVSMNFKCFKFRTFELEENMHVCKFPFPKYRSYEVAKASVLYKHISRMANF